MIVMNRDVAKLLLIPDPVVEMDRTRTPDTHEPLLTEGSSIPLYEIVPVMADDSEEK